MNSWSGGMDYHHLLYSSRLSIPDTSGRRRLGKKYWGTRILPPLAPIS